MPMGYIMNNERSNMDIAGSQTSQRQSYAAPLLLTYGALSDLTAGGKGSTAEQKAMTSKKRHP